MEWLSDLVMVLFVVIVIFLGILLTVTNPALSVMLALLAMMLFSLFGAGVIAAIRSSH